MEDGSQPPPPEKYEKPELTKHEDLTQVTFSSHGSPTETVKTPHVKKHATPAGAILEKAYVPKPNAPKRQHSFSQMLNGEKK